MLLTVVSNAHGRISRSIYTGTEQTCLNNYMAHWRLKHRPPGPGHDEAMREKVKKKFEKQKPTQRTAVRPNPSHQSIHDPELVQSPAGQGGVSSATKPVVQRPGSQAIASTSSIARPSISTAQQSSPSLGQISTILAAPVG